MTKRPSTERKIALIDLDATVIESWKQQAKPTYEGSQGYRPLLALGAEMGVAAEDEFRDGNVAAPKDPLPVFAALPASIQSGGCEVIRPVTRRGC